MATFTLVISPLAPTVTAGGTVALTATVTDAAGNAVTDEAVQWGSSNPVIATVSPDAADGVHATVQALLAGSANIVASYRGIAVSIGLAVTPAAVNSVRFGSIGSGDVTTCALSTTGAAYCWGRGVEGQIGDSNVVDRLVPTRVAGGHAFSSLSMGFDHACALTADGTAYCWGHNPDGELGDGTQLDRAWPVVAAAGMKFAVIEAGMQHTCGILTSGATVCWGANGYGQLGNGLTSSWSGPVMVSGGLAFTALAAGGGFSCGRAANGGWCWGANASGTLGTGGTTDSYVPVQVSGAASLVSVTAGQNFACGLTAAGLAYCWGMNARGQLGNGTTTDATAPTPVSGGLVFSRLSRSRHGTMCGITGAGAAYCWGVNDRGTVGNGTKSQSNNPATYTLVPSAVSGGHSFVQVSPGWGQTCALTGDGLAYCWGTMGLLGGGSQTGSLVPVPVTMP